MQLVLQQNSIDKPLTLTLVECNSVFIPVCSPNACNGVFNPNVTIFQSDCDEGLHARAFHCACNCRLWALPGF